MDPGATFADANLIVSVDSKTVAERSEGPRRRSHHPNRPNLSTSAESSYFHFFITACIFAFVNSFSARSRSTGPVTSHFKSVRRATSADEIIIW